MNVCSPLNFDPLIDSINNLEYFNEIPCEDLDEFDIFNQQFMSETIISNPDSTLSSNSIIDFNILQDQDINLDILLNQDFDIQDDFSHNFTDINIEKNIYFCDKTDFKSVNINKKPRKNKQKSILPYSIYDLDVFPQMNNNKSNLKNEDLIHGKPGDRIYLSKEERELLIRDGFVEPTHLPLTKIEERALKSVRRKIRNKISAKNSRAKKETYVEGLEQRIFLCSKENSTLRQKLADTESDKNGLYQQVVSLQKQLSKYLPNTTTHNTSLMLLFMTFMIILSPVLDPREIFKRYNFYGENAAKQIFPGQTRILLQESVSSIEIGEPYMVTIRPGPPWEIPPKTPAVPLKMIKSDMKMWSNNNISLRFINKTKIMNSI